MVRCRLVLLVLLAILCAAAAAPPASAAAATGDVLVALEPGSAGERLVASNGGQLLSRPLRIWTLGRMAAARVVPELERLGLLRFAEPDRIRRPLAAAGSDPLVAGAWYLRRVGAIGAAQPGPGVPVTILDGGVLLDYEELRSRSDLVSLNVQPTEPNATTAHGTILAAIAGAPENGVGTVGVYPRALLRAYALPDFSDASIIAGLDAVTAAGPGVINVSIGGPGYSRALYEAVLRAVNGGSIVVASAGNSPTGTAPDFYPADYPHVLTVGSTGRTDVPSPFSIRSPAVDLAAPGEEINVLDPRQPGQTFVARGTSYATPIVAAAGALVWTARSRLDATQVAELLRRTADDVGAKGFDDKTGRGILDLPAALEAPAPLPDPLEPNDDVDMVVQGGVFPTEKTAVNGLVRARVDEAEDPRDVYRLAVAAGATVTLTVKSRADLGLSLWRSATSSVLGRPGGNRLASSNRKGRAVERITWRNRTGEDALVFVDVWIPARQGVQRGAYTLRAGQAEPQRPAGR